MILMRRTKKTLSILLTLAMVFTMLPAITLTLTEKAQAYGTYTKNYTTEYYTGTTDDLKDAVSQGVPVIALLLYNGRSMHYVPVVGYDESHFFIQDSVEKYRNVTDNKSYNEKVDIDKFDAMWNLPIESCHRLFVMVRKTQ